MVSRKERKHLMERCKEEGRERGKWERERRIWRGSRK